MGRGIVAVGIVAACVVGMLFVAFVYNPFVIDLPPDEVEYSAFKYAAVKEDATGTSVTSATTRVWYDWDADGHMAYDEIGTFTESSGVYTSDIEYPIGLDYDIWVQVYASSYQVSYKLIHMTGDRNSDGSAKSVGQIELRATDDAVTYDGMINRVAWDDSTDYNATLSGLSGLAEVSVVLSAADKGLSSQIWDQVNYKSIYGLTKTYDYWVKWDQITTTGIPDGAVLAPDFFCIYMTVQDKVDLAPTAGDFDVNFNDGTNWFFISFVSTSWGDLMYNTADESAPRPMIDFNVGTITGVGTTVATYGVAIWQGITYEAMLGGTWTKSATYYLGTPGDDWDWTVV